MDRIAMKKSSPSLKVHTHVAGTVSGFNEMREEAAARPPREKNLRDVVGAAQTPSIRETFTETKKRNP